MVEFTVGGLFGLVIMLRASDKASASELVGIAVIAGITVLIIHGIRVMVCYMVEGSEKAAPGPPKTKPTTTGMSRVEPRIDNTWWKRLFTVMKWIIVGL